MTNRSSFFPIGAGRPCMGADGALAGTAGADKKVIVNLTKMLVCLLVIVSLLLSMVVPVHAIALTTGIAIATVGALVLAACGLILTAPTGSNLADYIGQQMDSYAISQGYTNRGSWLNGVTQQNVNSLNLFKVLDNAIQIPGGIYNALLAWAESFVEDNNIVSNGDPVGQPGGSAVGPVIVGDTSYSSVFSAYCYPDTYGAQLGFQTAETYWEGNPLALIYTEIDVSNLTFPLTWTITDSSEGEHVFGIVFTGFSYGNEIDMLEDDRLETKPDHLYFGIAADRDDSWSDFSSVVAFSVAMVTAAGTVITPSGSVAIPREAEKGQDAIIAGVPVFGGMTTADATDAILSQAATNDGLTADPELVGEPVPTAWGWLYDAISSLAESIANAIARLFVPSEGFWEEYVDSISDVFDDRMGILTYPLHVMTDFVDRLSDVQDGDHEMTWPDMTLNGVTIIRQGAYDFDDLLENESLEALYHVYLVIVKAIILGLFISLCWRKLEEIEQS